MLYPVTTSLYLRQVNLAYNFPLMYCARLVLVKMLCWLHKMIFIKGTPFQISGIVCIGLRRFVFRCLEELSVILSGTWGWYFLIEIFIEIIVGSHTGRSRKSEIPCAFFPVSPTDNIRKTVIQGNYQDIDMDNPFPDFLFHLYLFVCLYVFCSIQFITLTGLCICYYSQDTHSPIITRIFCAALL